MDVFRQRLEDEYDANVIVTAPTVPYKGNPFHRDCSSLNMTPISFGSAVQGREDCHR